MKHVESVEYTGDWMSASLYEPDDNENNKLDSSGITSPTETSSVGEEEACTSWWGGIGADFRTLASNLKSTAGEVVGFVHRSALSVAQEIAELERHDLEERPPPEALRLPWEIAQENGEYQEDEELKEKIFLLSYQESSFLEPFTPSNDDDDNGAFCLDEPRIQLIRNLLEMDENLASTHARLSGRSYIREAVFWRNYFYHCDQTREEHLLEGSQSSLVPADAASVQSGDSYVCVSRMSSAPNSLNSTGLRSVDDLVLVDSPGSSPVRRRV